MHKNIRNAVRTFLIEDNSVICTKYKVDNVGYIDIPGGKIEEGEIPTQTAIREMKEETGITVKNLKYKEDFTPLDPDCACYCCRNYTKAYLRHMINVGEMAGAMLLSLHNITYLHNLMRGLRESILGGYVRDFAREFYKQQENVSP